MARFVLKCLVMIFFFSFLSCVDKKKSDTCYPFCEGDEWYLYEFEADPYPLTVPFEESRFLSALENELFLWKLEGDNLTLKGKGGERVTFRYEGGGIDTLTLSVENGERRKFIVKETSADDLHLEMVGIYHVNVYLKK